MTFQTIKVIDGDTFVVSPQWKWQNETGSHVRPTGYNTPEKGQLGYETSKSKLVNLILGKDVELRKAYRIDRSRLVCDVYFNGRNLADFFPEYN